MNVYFVSGLAADRRVFRHIKLPSHCNDVHLDWIAPEKNESLAAYAARLADPIQDGEPFAIVGLSMGGMITTEIARLKRPSAVILISSVPSSAELPFYFHLAGKLRLNKLVPISMVKSVALAKRRVVRESDDDKDVLRAIIRDSDNHFIRWAMDAILKWRSVAPGYPYTHIHGTHDIVLPMRYTRPTHVIQNAGHLMIMTRAAEINRILREILSGVSTATLAVDKLGNGS